MSVKEEIKNYIAGFDEAKSKDLQALHKLVLQVNPKFKLWFLDGKNEAGKVVTNPNVGYGLQTMKYADGSNREFYEVGFSANTTGISFYIIGLKDKKHLINAYGKRIGKATVTGYCIKFKALKDIDTDVLQEAIRFRLAADK